MSEFSFSPVGFIRSPWQEKFAIPRQPGLVEDGTGELHFVAPYNHADCVRGLEQFSHVWVIFVFHDIPAGSWRPLVRPPRLGGNQRMGIFATRSPFRPNPIGLSCVELAGIETTPTWGTVLRVRGADLADGSPILDIKPYIPYADSHPGALEGFASVPAEALEVVIPPDLLQQIPSQRLEALRGVLAQDPRPRYQEDPQRVYGFGFAGMEIKFSVSGQRLTVLAINSSR